VVDYDLLRAPTQGAYKMEIVARNNRTKAKASASSRVPAEGHAGRPHLADGNGHTLEAARPPTTIQLLLDGATFTKTANVGWLTNTGPVSLGAESYRGGGSSTRG
jgi:hypothetical protein